MWVEGVVVLLVSLVEVHYCFAFTNSIHNMKRIHQGVQQQHHHHQNGSTSRWENKRQSQSIIQIPSSTSLSSSPKYKTYNDSTNERKHDDVPVKRALFQLHQVKGELQESEMRATAAERRVALLKHEIQKLNQEKDEEEKGGEEEQQQQQQESQSQQDIIVDDNSSSSSISSSNSSKMDDDGDGNTNDDNTSNESSSSESEKAFATDHMIQNKIQSLKNSVKGLNEKMNLKIDTILATHEREQVTWQIKEEKLNVALEKARSDHTDALREIDTFIKTEEELKRELSKQQYEHTTRMDDLKWSHAAEMKQLELETSTICNNLKVEKIQLEEHLTDAKEKVKELNTEIIRVEKVALDNVQSIRQEKEQELGKKNQEVAFVKSELGDRNEQIEKLQDERASIRKLTKIQLSILKSRVVKRYRGIMSRIRY
jgi:hypothetical protein